MYHAATKLAVGAYLSCLKKDSDFKPGIYVGRWHIDFRYGLDTPRMTKAIDGPSMGVGFSLTLTQALARAHLLS